MPTLRQVAALSLLPAATALALPAPRPALSAAGEPDSLAELDIRVSPLMDLVMLVRSLAEKDQAAGAGPLGAAVQAARAGADAMGGHQGWGVFQGPASSLERAEDMLALCRQMPAQFTNRSGVSFELRAVSTAFAEALVEVEPWYREELWPKRRDELEIVAERLRAELIPRQEEVYTFVQEHLGITAAQARIPVFLVLEAPWPGAHTYRSRAGSMCFVSLQDHEGSQLLESIVHESLHVLDESSRRTGSVFTELATGLEAAGVPASDARSHDVPHTVMFVQAAETVRRLFDEGHVDYGEIDMWGKPGLYARQPRLTAAVRPVWKAYLDGEMDRADAVARIVDGVTGG